MSYVPNPNEDTLRALAIAMRDGLVAGRGGRFSGSGRLTQLRAARGEADTLDAGRDYLNKLDAVIRAVTVLDEGRRVMTKREATLTLQTDLPRMSDSASWPGYRALTRILASTSGA